jgi:hypothetical protein
LAPALASLLAPTLKGKKKTDSTALLPRPEFV